MSTAQSTSTLDAPPAGSTFDKWSIAFAIFAISNIANGLWMLIDPVHWYFNLPAAVPDFGPLNEHFVRDIGCIFFMLGAALALGAALPSWRVAACALNAVFYVLHALVHVIDTSRGLVGPSHWLIDMGGVYLPAVLIVALTVVMARRTA